MKQLVALSVAVILVFSVTACKTDEHALRDNSAILLSAKEVKEIFVGNTVTASTGDTFYFDRGGAAVGKGSYGDKNRGNWNITSEGQLCLSNWNSSFGPSACYKVFFDNATQQRKLIDINGDMKYLILNVVTGNPNNFN
jgi:hypothetical protein